MKDHKDCRRAFHWSSKAWYSKYNPPKNPEIHFGMYHKDGSTSGEMAMVWNSLENKKIPQLCVFDDAWNALSLFTDLIQKLAGFDDENITEEKFIEILKEHNFEDITAYEEG